MTQEQLDAIRTRVEAATPGEWWWYGPPHSYSGGEQLVTTDDKKPILWTELASDRIEAEHADADLIANAPADVRALLTEVDTLRARVAELEAEHQTDRDYLSAYTDRAGALYTAAVWVCSARERRDYADDKDLDALCKALNDWEGCSEEEEVQCVRGLKTRITELEATVDDAREQRKRWHNQWFNAHTRVAKLETENFLLREEVEAAGHGGTVALLEEMASMSVEIAGLRLERDARPTRHLPTLRDSGALETDEEHD